MHITNTLFFNNSEYGKESTSLVKLFKLIFFKLLCCMLPKKTKRLIFLATLVVAIKKITDPSKALSSKLNHHLKLADTDEAIMFAMCFGTKFWKRKLNEGIYLSSLEYTFISIDEIEDYCLTSAELRIAATTILYSTPKWLRYGSKNFMRNEVITLLKLIPKFKKETA